ncbi:hypothetical protein GCM10017687_44960 [Streptomyces echinatus]
MANAVSPCARTGRANAAWSRYVVPDGSASTGRDAADQVGEWREIYDTMYGGTEVGTDGVGEDFTGWNSSYTGRPIPLPQMRDWREAVLRRVRSLRPRRVLEVGVGSGLLLGPLAPEAEEYWGTDFSAPVVERLRAQTGADPRLSDKVTLRCQPADDAEGLPAGYFDTVILNSVVQYFPDAGYLTRVLDLAMERLAPGGRVVLGDIRNHRTLRTFAAAVHRCRQPDDGPAAVQAAVERAVLGEKELVVDPGFFTRWAEARPDAVAADIRLKQGTHHNELTRHRYEVVLHKAPAKPLDLGDLPEAAWGAEVREVADLEAALARHGGRLRLTRVPNSRLAGEAAEWGAPAELGGTLDPAELEEWGARRGLAVYCTWSAQAGDCFDAAVVPDVDAVCLDGLYRPVGAPSGRPTNVPAVSRRVSRLPSVLRERLAGRLPEFMMPADIVVLDRLPLTENGKVDRAALPEPDAGGGDHRAPRTPREEELAALFAEVLGLDRIGIDDDFFAFGGHSLRLTRLVWRIHEKLGVDVPIRTVFQYPTVAALAAQLSADTEADDFEDPFRRPAADPHRGPPAPAVVAAPGRRAELALPGLRPPCGAVPAAVRHPGTRLRRDHPAGRLHRGDGRGLSRAGARGPADRPLPPAGLVLRRHPRARHGGRTAAPRTRGGTPGTAGRRPLQPLRRPGSAGRGHGPPLPRQLHGAPGGDGGVPVAGHHRLLDLHRTDGADAAVHLTAVPR